MRSRYRTVTCCLALLVVAAGVVAAAGPATATTDDDVSVAPALAGDATLTPTLAGDATLTDGGVYWQGQQVDCSAGVDAGVVVEVRAATDAGELFVQVADEDLDGTVTVDTAHLDPGTYVLEDEDNQRLATFDVVAQTLTVDQADGDLQFSSNRGSYDVDVTADGVSAATLADAIDGAEAVDTDGDGVNEAVRLDAGASTTVALDRTALPDDVVLSFDVNDSTAADAVAFGDATVPDDGTDGDDGSTGDDGDAGDLPGPVVRWTDGVDPNEVVEVRGNATGTLYLQVVADANGTAAIDVGALPNGTYYVEDAQNQRLGTFTAPDGEADRLSAPAPDPADPNGDGVYEDVNGDGGVDILDVQALFASLDTASETRFDVNGDGSVDVLDVQALFSEL